MKSTMNGTRREATLLLRVLPPRGAIMGVAWAIALAAALVAGRAVPAPSHASPAGVVLLQR
jgi:hypothetical protein